MDKKMLTNGKICILIPTFPRYKVLAEFTEKMLDKYWRQHPRIYFSGCENSEDKNWLTTQRSPSSWMHETYDAVKMLRDMGFLRCYLILDDHPPVRKCHSKHLNVTIPEFFEKLDATYIGLLGWGQNREQCDGERLGDEFFNLENVTLDFKYKFSLHPGLWNLERLSQILWIMIDNDDSNFGPWRFEKFAGFNDKVSLGWRKAAYRVSGLDMSIRKLFPKTIKLQYHALFFRKWFPSLDAVGYYYEGPYPMIWSGVMQKGKPNSRFQKYLIYFLKWGYYWKLKKALSAFKDILNSEGKQT